MKIKIGRYLVREYFFRVEVGGILRREFRELGEIRSSTLDPPCGSDVERAMGCARSKFRDRGALQVSFRGWA